MQKRFPVGRAIAVAFAGLLVAGLGHAAVTIVFFDGGDRAVDSPSRGVAGRAAWESAVTARNGTIATDDFNGVDIDIPAGVETSVGQFSVYYEQTGGYPSSAGNTAAEPHPTGVFVGTTGTGGVAAGNAEVIDGLELRIETREPLTTLMELRFDPPIFAWSADVYSVDGPGFGEGLDSDPTASDHTTLHVLEHAFDLTEVVEYSGSGYMSFFGIISEEAFDRIRFTAGGDGDRFRLDNVAIAR